MKLIIANRKTTEMPTHWLSSKKLPIRGRNFNYFANTKYLINKDL